MISYQKHSKAEGGAYYWLLEDYTEGTETEITDFVFPRGSSFWLSFDAATDFTQAGSVNKKPVTYTIPGGGAFVQAGNCRPVALKLGDIEFSDLARGDSIQIFDTIGDCVKMISYQKHSKAEGGAYYWLLEDYAEGTETEIDPATFEFAPGQAFWLSLENEGSVIIPGIEL